MLDALVQSGGLSPSELAEAYELQGLAFVAQNDAASAEAVFSSMLAIDPARRPSGRVARDATVPLAAALRSREGVEPLRIDAGMQTRWASGSAPVIQAAVLGDTSGIVARLDVSYRLVGGGAYGLESVTGAGPHRITLTTLAQASPQPLEWYAEAFDDFGNRLALQGSADAPKTIDPTLLPDAEGTARPALAPVRASTVDVEAPWAPSARDAQPAEESDSGGVTSSWWFWGGLAVLAVGGAAAAVALSGGSATSTPGSTEPVCFGEPCDAVLEAP